MRWVSLLLCRFLSISLEFFLCPNVKIRVSGYTVGEPPFFPSRNMSYEWVSDSCLTPIHHFSAISWQEQVNFQWDGDEILFVLDQQAELVFIVLAHWNNSPRVDMSLHSDTLFWFRANQSLLFLLNAACLAEKQQIPIL
jgi:hypothetical protein